ncbi:aprataxin and PNK-like factor isoform X3 [Tamandua tetradactyla]|uniref:aprataxin and PNK-like factor isoform X3 n=1 Tax=Tamandua tetradactyla TaxID=48850 RepID=UPI0040540514
MKRKITDKRVSRRHAILEVVDGQLRIKPIHTNPCFYQSSEKSQLLPLKTNLWHWLNPGDSFSLLVDKYAFHVFSTQSETELEYTLRCSGGRTKSHISLSHHLGPCLSRNSQMLDEDEILNETTKPLLINLPNETTCVPQLERDTEISKTQTTPTNSMSFPDEYGDFSKQQLNFAQRKRILPAWMLAENLSDQNLSILLISGDNDVIQGDGKEGIRNDKTQINISCQGRKRSVSSGNSESTQDPGKKCKNAVQEESVNSSKEVSQSSSVIPLSKTEVTNVNTQRKELGEVSDHGIVTKRTTNKKGEAVSCSESCSRVQGESLHNESQSSHPKSDCDLSHHEDLHAKQTVSVPQDSEENKVKRTSCMYGANCYRKNPVHFQHFSHPGDSDYGSVQDMHQGEANDKPECPYGASCYRMELLIPQCQSRIHPWKSSPTSSGRLSPLDVMSHIGEKAIISLAEFGLERVRPHLSNNRRGPPEVTLRHTYRKNPQHKIEYKHSTLLVRSTLGDSDDVGQPSEHDVDVNFIDDKEEEYEPTDEDSDWEPEKEDQEKEDVEELLKEAKTFMKRKN